MKDNKKVLICMAVDPTGQDIVVEGSVIRECSSCEQEVSVAPSGIKLIEDNNGDVDILCSNCMLAKKILQEKDVSFGIAPGAKAELIGELLKEQS